MQISTYTNYTGYLLQIYLPNGQLYHNQTYGANTTQPFLVPINAPYGIYTAKARIPNGTSTALFTILDISNWIPVSFPYGVEHNRINYTFYNNYTFRSSFGSDSFNLDFGMLRALAKKFGLEVTPTSNSMNFRANFKNTSKQVNIDVDFAFIHTGCKLIINGSIDQARDFTFNISKYEGSLKKILQGVKIGHLVFDWTDIKKAGDSFQYEPENHTLRVQIPQTFRLDPTIFTDGFELGDFSLWDSEDEDAGCEINVSQLDPHHESYHAHAVTDADGNYARITYTDGGGLSEDTLYTRIYFQVKAFPGSQASHSWFLRFSGSSVIAYARFYYSSYWRIQLRIRDSGTWVWNLGDTALALDTWYSIELGSYIHATAGWGRIWLNGAKECEVNNTDTDNFGNFASVATGISGGDTSNSDYIDCVVISDEYVGVEAEGRDITLTYSQHMNLTSSYEALGSFWMTNQETMILTSTFSAFGAYFYTDTTTLALSSSYEIHVALFRFETSTMQLSSSFTFQEELYRTLQSIMNLDSLSEIYRAILLEEEETINLVSTSDFWRALQVEVQEILSMSSDYEEYREILIVITDTMILSATIDIGTERILVSYEEFTATSEGLSLVYQWREIRWVGEETLQLQSSSLDLGSWFRSYVETLDLSSSPYNWRATSWIGSAPFSMSSSFNGRTEKAWTGLETMNLAAIFNLWREIIVTYVENTETMHLTSTSSLTLPAAPVIFLAPLLEIVLFFVGSWYFSLTYWVKKHYREGMLAALFWIVTAGLWLLINPVGYAVALAFFGVGIFILVTAMVVLLNRLELSKYGDDKEL